MAWKCSGTAMRLCGSSNDHSHGIIVGGQSNYKRRRGCTVVGRKFEFASFWGRYVAFVWRLVQRVLLFMSWVAFFSRWTCLGCCNEDARKQCVAKPLRCSGSPRLVPNPSVAANRPSAQVSQVRCWTSLCSVLVVYYCINLNASGALVTCASCVEGICNLRPCFVPRFRDRRPSAQRMAPLISWVDCICDTTSCM